MLYGAHIGMEFNRKLKILHNHHSFSLKTKPMIELLNVKLSSFFLKNMKTNNSIVKYQI